MNNVQQMNLLGIYSASPKLLQERNFIMKMYNFYDGPAKTAEQALHEITQGQSWVNNADLDYSPTQEIRNHTKKLLQKQARFMFGVSPSILFKPLQKDGKDKAEQKRMIIDQVLDEANFWGLTAKAFLDCTIGKRALLLVVSNSGEPIKFRYYTSLDFTYETDPNDYTKVTQVIIAYQDESTTNKPADQQIWHRWKYYMKGEQCWLIQGTYDGNAKSLGDETDTNTGFDELPCRVITNGGLTGDIEGESDVYDLIDMANSYNKTTSDYRDALRFKMFEQPVFTDADIDSIKNIKVAPNALIDLKSDPASEEGKQAKAEMLSSTFSFTNGADAFLDRVKADMYELMDQPRPEDLRDVPSAKALKFMFYDLMARCEEKWQTWEPVMKWLVRFVIKCVDKFNLYPEMGAKAVINTPTSIVFNHNYPIPEDEETQKKIAIAEVEGKVRSHKSYIRDLSDIEDEDMEWQEILAESKEITTSTDSLTLGMGNGAVEGDEGAGDDGKGGQKQDKGGKQGADGKGTTGGEE